MKKLFSFLFVLLIATVSFAQNFEAPKNDGSTFEDVKVKVGAGFAIQVNGLSQESPNVALKDVKKNVPLPTATLNLGAELAPGISVMLETYLSSRHHNEAWVKGGYLTIDKLPIAGTDAIMKNLTITAGVIMPNYGDAHFYRSDNGNVAQNPFVGNWIMDAFTTNPGVEVLWRNNGWLGMIGANNGRLNYGRGTSFIGDLVYNWKVGFDKQLDEKLRLRATVSGYHVGDGHVGSYLYDGDRAGARYYEVMQPADATSDNYKAGRWSPGGGQSKMNNIMVNFFVKAGGLEVFGMYENSKGIKKSADQHFTQWAIQPIYRIGTVYVGARYNTVNNNDGAYVNRTNIGGGWNMTQNVVMKLDYVNQSYHGTATGFNGAQFKGMVMEAAIHF